MTNRNIEAELLDEGLKVLGQELGCGPNFYEIREQIAKLKAASTKPDLLNKVDSFSEQVGEQKSTQQRYKLLSDNDDHHYLVPMENENAFNMWVDSFNEDDEGDPGGYEKLGAESLGCSPTCMSFTDPKVD